MGFGCRTFIVTGDEIIERLSQRRLNAFTGGKRVLSKYAGRTVDLAFAYYQTKDGKPYEVIRIEGGRYVVSNSGAMDAKHRDEALRLSAHALDGFLEGRKPRSAGNIINAKADFNRRRRKARHTPDISPRLVRKILAALGL